MSKSLHNLTLLFFILWLAGSAATAPAPKTADLPPLPAIVGHLTAPGSQLTPQQRDDIDKLLGTFQQKYKVDLAVYVLPGPLEADMRKFAALVFKGWRIGLDWKSGGLLLLVSSDGTKCVWIQSETPRVLPEATLKQFSSTVEGRGSQSLANALRGWAERCDRVLGRATLPKYREPLERDIKGATHYAVGSLVTLLLAAVAIALGLGRPD